MTNAPPPVPTIDVREAERRLREDPARPLLVDVREQVEFAEVRAPGAVLVPTSSFMTRQGDLPTDRPLLVICHIGGRSAAVTAYLTACRADGRRQRGRRDGRVGTRRAADPHWAARTPARAICPRSEAGPPGSPLRLDRGLVRMVKAHKSEVIPLPASVSALPRPLAEWEADRRATSRQDSAPGVTPATDSGLSGARRGEAARNPLRLRG